MVFASTHSPAIAMQDAESINSSNSAGHTLTFTLKTDGTWTAIDDVTGSEGSGNWLWPPGAASGDYAVTATLVSESTFTGTPAHTGTFGSSLALSSDRAWTQTVASDPADPSTLVIDLDFTWKGGAKGHTVRVSFTVS